jgi:hypothetical protein
VQHARRPSAVSPSSRFLNATTPQRAFTPAAFSPIPERVMLTEIILEVDLRP